jgi:hypothetical protein
VIAAAARKARLRRRRKISAAKRAANRRNARRSTGPRTAAGKARSAQNALRHGLTSRLLTSPAWSGVVADFTRAIMGSRTDDHSRACAGEIAFAHIRVLQVRQAKRKLYASELGASGPGASGLDTDGLGWSELVRRLASLDRHERRAWSRRKFAIRRFDALGFGQNQPSAENFGQNEPTGEKSLAISSSWPRNPGRRRGVRRRPQRPRWLRSAVRKPHNGLQSEPGTRRRYHRCC